MVCKYCEHAKVCKDREEFEYLNSLYKHAMASYRPDYEKPKLSDIPYINIPDLNCTNYKVNHFGYCSSREKKYT